MIEENIRHLRKNAKMSQEDLAEKLSVVRQTVSKWKRGLSVPDAEMVIKMADLFGVPVSELLGMEQEHGAARAFQGKDCDAAFKFHGQKADTACDFADLSIEELGRELERLNSMNKGRHEVLPSLIAALYIYRWYL